MKKKTEMKKKRTEKEKNRKKISKKRKRPSGPTAELGWPVPRAGVCGARYAPTWSVYRVCPHHYSESMEASAACVHNMGQARLRPAHRIP
jgi:hypothetical protein